MAEAEALLPRLLELPGALLRRELRTRPELRTPGVMRRLLAVARDARERFPMRAHELTLSVVRYVGAMRVPPAFAAVASTLKGEAWREHALTLRDLGQIDKAETAIAIARAYLRRTPASEWHLATVDLIEAPLLHDRGQHGEALAIVRRAARQFALRRDHGRHLEARMIESWMLLSSGAPEAAAAVWTEIYKTATERGDTELMGQVAAKLGVFELRHGDAEKASHLLTAAVELLANAEVTEEAVRARWNLAEAAAARGRMHEAISEYHKVRAELVARGSLNDAAIASADVLDLFLLAGRDNELRSFTMTLVRIFCDAGMLTNGIEAFAWLRARAEAESLTHDDIVLVRRYFEDLPQQPNVRFLAP
ncbi:MAG TPA: hypothetical protein VGQ36_16310 [Thermoanaerobaculia bacterium]|jgi:tetratricopeptide (TPR) repeat protein|nr:hypothetical protein [Thermoanaerobaculia bacterium]